MPDPVDPTPRPDTEAGSQDPTLAPGWYRIRRTVKFRNFLLTGAVLGFLLGAFVSAIGPESPRAGAASAMAFLGMVGALTGTLIAGVAAVLLDRRLDRGTGTGTGTG